MASAIGIDVGGTKIAAGAVDLATGEILDERVQPTEPARGGDAVLRDVLEIANALKTKGSTLGLGLAELVSPEGRILSEATFAWKDLPVLESLNAILPARIEADVRAAARAEAKWGSGRDLDSFLYVTVGTGISCCLVLGGKPFAGARGMAGTFASAGGLVALKDGSLAETLALEDFASGSALARRTSHSDRQHGGRALGAAIAQLVNTMDPRAVVIGGGLGCAGGLFIEAVKQEFYTRLWSELHRETQILSAKLGPDAGWIGAALASVEE
jgi:glucokinase